MVANKVLFLYKFLSNPKKIGSVTPSSTFLTKAMLKTVQWDKVESFVELGAGTGALTAPIRDRMKLGCKGLIIEQDRVMRRQLNQRFPELVFRPFAEELPNYLDEMGIKQVDFIFSGLPFANFPPAQRSRVIAGVEKSLKPGGKFIAFQYSLQMRGELLKHFDSVHIQFVPLNIPPAFVYCCQKRGDVSNGDWLDYSMGK